MDELRNIRLYLISSNFLIYLLCKSPRAEQTSFLLRCKRGSTLVCLFDRQTLHFRFYVSEWPRRNNCDIFRLLIFLFSEGVIISDTNYLSSDLVVAGAKRILAAFFYNGSERLARLTNSLKSLCINLVRADSFTCDRV